jgi:hypothetical protein
MEWSSALTERRSRAEGNFAVRHETTSQRRQLFLPQERRGFFHREEIMQHASPRHNRHLFDMLHPAIHKAAIGFALWYILAMWIFFAGHGYQFFDLVMMSFIILAAIVIPAAVIHTRRHFLETYLHTEDPKPGALHSWLAGDFDTWQARISAREAAVQILLPLAAVSIGATLLGVVLLFTPGYA